MSEMTVAEKDAQARERITNEIETNFFVEAGAGSGKTTMLVSRMIAMVEAGIPIEKICAITFTKAAANEFYDRFRKRLTETGSERCEEALKNIDLCFMGTIDSFCGMVLSEHPFEARITSDASVINESEQKVFYRQQYVRICEGACGEELAGKAKMFRMLHRDAEEVFARGELIFMGNRNVHFNYRKPAEIDLDKAFAFDRENILRALKCLTEHRELAYPSDNKNIKAWERIDETYRILNRKWSSDFSGVMYGLRSFRNLRLLPEAVNQYEPELSGLFVPGGKYGKWLECAISDESGLLKKLQNYRYSVSMDFLESCVPVLENAMRESGRMTFFDYLYYLRNLLRDDAKGDGKLIRYIAKRHSFFLIDEFQDTNPLQAEIFFYLAAEHLVPEWKDCIPRPGSLFIVGDPKQSIYRFRSADVASFMKVKELFEKNGGAVVSLLRNFRSTSVLCAYFNRVFAEMLPDEIPDPETGEGELQGVFSYHAYIGKNPENFPGESDQERIADIIERLVGNEKYLIRTDRDMPLRKLTYGDIMVITDKKRILGPIMAVFEEKGIPAKVEGEVRFSENEALAEIYRIYTCAANPDDALSLYGALTGTLIGLSSEDILVYRENGGKLSLYAVFDKEACENKTALLVANEIEKLKNLSFKAKNLSPAALFSEILDDFRVYETVEAENLEIVYYVLELLRNAEKSGSVVSLQDGANYIATLMNGESDEERCLSLTEKNDAVRMANLHKVKGLEAPVVILAGAAKKANVPDKRIVHRDEGAEGYLFALKKDGFGDNYFETTDFSEEVETEKEAAAEEQQRLVYVAATRARNALIICDGMQEQRRGTPVWETLLEDTVRDFFVFDDGSEPAEKDVAEEISVEELYEEAEKACVLNDRSAEEKTFSVENPSRLKLSSKMSEEREVVVTETGNSVDARLFPALLGTMTHKLMEMLVSSKNRTSAESAVMEILREYRTPETEPYENYLRKKLLTVAEQMRYGGYPQTNGLPQDILGTLLKAEEVYCEVPFCYREDTEGGVVLWNGVMDAVYRLEGRWHIIDYKTNADGSDLDEKYAAQLNAYIRAFKAVTKEDADALTYHIDI